jgi:transcriptional regulator with XRE-family HTH domain
VADSVELRSRIVGRIKALLGSKGISNEQLAERSSLRPARIKRILAGRFIRITANELTLIAAVLSTPVYGLLIPTDPAIEVEALEVIEKGRSSHA